MKNFIQYKTDFINKEPRLADSNQPSSHFIDIRIYTNKLRCAYVKLSGDLKPECQKNSLYLSCWGISYSVKLSKLLNDF